FRSSGASAAWTRAEKQLERAAARMLAQFIVKRLLLSVPMLIGVTLVTFVVSHLIPADPLTAVLPERAADNPDIVAMYRVRWGLDRPLPEQSLLYLRNLVHGDLGESYTTRRPVG